VAKKIRVLVVDDSAIVRKVLSEMIDAAHDMELLDVAQDPIFAWNKMKKNWPDVITLDVEMPRMNGITFLRKIMSERPTPVVMCSKRTAEGSRESLEALRIGAIDVVEKPKVNLKAALKEGQASLLSAIRVAFKANIRAYSNARVAAPVPKQNKEVAAKYSADAMLTKATRQVQGEWVVAIGTSTGGTKALEDVLANISTRALPPMMVVQHMPEQFTKTFAERLNSISILTVVEAEDGMTLCPGSVYIAPGGKHMMLGKSGPYLHAVVKGGPRVNRHCPSVDVLFRSVAKISGKNALGVIMTGMGDDGAAGLKEIKAQGALTLGQDEASCVVYGMPAAARACGAVDRELDLMEIPAAITHFGHQARA